MKKLHTYEIAQFKSFCTVIQSWQVAQLARITCIDSYRETSKLHGYFCISASAKKLLTRIAKQYMSAQGVQEYDIQHSMPKAIKELITIGMANIPSRARIECSE